MTSPSDRYRLAYSQLHGWLESVARDDRKGRKERKRMEIDKEQMRNAVMHCSIANEVLARSRSDYLAGLVCDASYMMNVALASGSLDRDSYIAIHARLKKARNITRTAKVKECMRLAMASLDRAIWRD